MDEQKIGKRISKTAVRLFGRYQPPEWSVALIRRGRGWLGRHKKTSIVIVALLLVNAVGGYFGYRYWQSRPKPQTVDVSVTSPEPTMMAKDAPFHPVVIRFAQPAAPLALLNKEVKKGVALKPSLAGKWFWRSDKELVFAPRQDWPVGTLIEVELARQGLCAKHVLLSTYRLEFTTPAFGVQIASSEFYQDPVAADLKKVVVTFSFTHAVDDTTFKKHVKLRFTPSNKEQQPRDLGFTASYDKLKGKAFIHSEPIPVPPKDAMVAIELQPGARAARGGPPFQQKLTGSVRVPGVSSFLRVSEITTRVVDNERFEPEQILTVEASLGVASSELRKSIEAWVLPKHHPEKKQDQPHRWSNVEEISEQLLKRSKRIKLEQLVAAKEFDTIHNFRFSEPAGRYLYVRVREGMRSFGGYLLGESTQEIVTVPSFPKQVKFLHSGSLLSLSGDHHVTVLARDVPGVRFRIARVLHGQLHHFVSQTSGSFTSPSFPDSIKPEHLADFREETRAISSRPGKPAYESLSLTPYLNDGQRHRGLFLIRCETWDPVTKNTDSPSDERLILVTDLGVFVKRAVDRSQRVFVQSIQTGKPVAGAKVEVLGKNGLAVATATTGPLGDAKLPSLESLKQEREPIVYLVQSGKDWSFLPFEDRDRVLNVSRFDVGGVTEAAQGSELGAFLFSDRGVYRPGESFQIGAIVRRQDWKEAYKGLPLVATIVDPRGLEIKRIPLVLDAAGFSELSHQTQETSPTGKYTTNLYSARDGNPQGFLGAVTVQVREFLPDTMRIKVSLNKEARGWVHPQDLKARVLLTNLYGTPRSESRVRVTLRLRPGLPSLAEFPGYRFYDPLLTREPHEEKLPEAQTDENGVASFDLALRQFAQATYLLSVQAEGFEGQGGRSVLDEAHIVVSPLPHLVGWKSDSDLSYLPRGSQHSVQIVAVAPGGKAAGVSGLSAVQIERKHISVLTKQENGTYKYQSVPKEIELSKKALAIGAGGTSLPLPTQRPGDFAIVIRGGKGETWQRIEYTVAGAANLSRTMERSGELQIALAKSSIGSGGTLQLEIKAPFAGAGLITVERDQVYAHKWFVTETNTTVQTIEVPKELEIGGYVAVAFVRSAKSDEVLINSLAHGVVPFSIDREKRSIAIGIESAPLGKPGQALAIRVKSNRPARAVVYAVDEGILRVAGYTTPNPLDHFLKKRSLGVRTAQLLDLILPGQRRLGAQAPGGDAEGRFLGANLNPFKRRRDKPAVYWSGIVDVGPTPKLLSYTPPDSFNGSLRIMAVAASPDAVGSAAKPVIIRGDFVLTPSVPVVVAPGDSFDVPVTVANNVEGSGKSAKTTLGLTVSEHLEIVGEKQKTLSIDEGREATATFRIRAREKLGSGSLGFVASLGGKQGKRSVDLSVRPASPYLTTLLTGYLKPGQTREVPIARKLVSEHRELKTGVSGVPLTLAHGLASYLRGFPHLCTEQLSSQAVPAVVLGKSPDFGFSAKAAHESVARFVERVWARQNADGSFGVWAANPHVSPQAVVYTMQVLAEARERGYLVPDPLWKRGHDYLQKLAKGTPDDLPEARVRTWAIYLLTRNGMVTTSFATAAQRHLAANHPKDWQEDLAGAYLAATSQLLKKSEPAEEIMRRQKLGARTVADYAHLYDGLARDSQLLYLLARHFPQRAAAVKQPQIDAIVEAIAGGGYNTFSSAFTIMALEAFAALSRAEKGGLSVAQKLGGAEQLLRLPDTLMPLVPFSPQATALVFKNPGAIGRYFLVSQQGFDATPEKKPLAQGLEVFREYLDEKDQPVATVKLGDPLKVRFLIRALGKPQSNLAIVDLLPGGFEVVIQSSAPEPSSGDGDSDSSDGDSDSSDGDSDGDGDSGGGRRRAPPRAPLGLPIAVDGTSFSPDYWDVREDRVVLYGDASTESKKYFYMIKATSTGSFVVPPVQGASLYDRRVVARGKPGTLTVTKAK